MKSNHFKSCIDFTAPEKKQKMGQKIVCFFPLFLLLHYKRQCAEKKQTQQSHSDQGQLSSITHKEGKKTKNSFTLFHLALFSSIQPNTHKAEEEAYTTWQSLQLLFKSQCPADLSLSILMACYSIHILTIIVVRKKREQKMSRARSLNKKKKLKLFNA